MHIPISTTQSYEDFIAALSNINPLEYTKVYIGHKALVEYVLLRMCDITLIDIIFPYVSFSYFSKHIKYITNLAVLNHIMQHYVTNSELFCLVSDVLCENDSILTKMSYDTAYGILDHLNTHQLLSESLIYLMDIDPDEFVNYLIHIRQIDIMSCYCCLDDCTCTWLLKNILLKCSVSLCQELFVTPNDCEFICYIKKDLKLKLDAFNATKDILSPRVLKDLIDKEYYENIAVIVLKFPTLIERYKIILRTHMYKFTSLHLLIYLGAPPSYIKLVIYEHSNSKKPELLGEIISDEKLKDYMEARKMRSDICKYAPAEYFTKKSISVNKAYGLFYKFSNELFEYCYEYICNHGTFKQFRKIVQISGRYRRTFALMAAKSGDIRREYYYMHTLKNAVKKYYMEHRFIGIVNSNKQLKYVPRNIVKFIPKDYLLPLFINAVKQRKHKVAKNVLSFINYNNITIEQIMEVIKYTSNTKILYKFIKKISIDKLSAPILKEYSEVIGDYMVLSMLPV